MARGSLKNSAETKVFLDNSNKNKENLLSTDLTNEIAKGYISGKKTGDQVLYYICALKIKNKKTVFISIH